MYPAERQAHLVRTARAADGSVSVAEASRRLGVTPETIRRDLAVLERQGLLRRRHGGATLMDARPFEPPLPRRRDTEAPERRAVARRVAALLPAEGVVILDAGSMTLDVAASIDDRHGLLVVTSSLPAAEELTRRTRVAVLLLPGRVRAVTQATVGEWAVERLRSLNADVAVIGANGVDVAHGAFSTRPEESELKRAMMASSRRRVLAVTAAKFERSSFDRVAGLDEFDVVVTDDRLDDRTRRAVSAAGPELIVASTISPDTPGKDPA